MLTIDAQGKTLGRVASAAAKALLGKHAASFAKNVVAQDGVTIINASKIAITGGKERAKEYLRYSGYMGGLKREPYYMLVARFGHEEAIRRAIKGMLPKNRLQTPRLLKLTIQK